MLVLGALAAMGPAAMDMVALALPNVARDLGVEPSATQLTITTFLLGLASGQVIAGPLSDVFGRRKPLLAGVTLYTAAGLLCSIAPSVPVLAGSRFVQGSAAAAGVVISRAMIKDMYDGPLVARQYSRLFLVMGVTPALAPLLAAQILDVASWRAIFVALTVFGALLLLAGGLRLPETLPPERRRPGGLRQTLGTFGGLLTHRPFMGYALALGSATAALIALVAGSPFVVEDVFDEPAGTYAVLFLTGAVSMMVTTQLNAKLVRRISPRRLLFTGLGLVALGGTALVTIGDRGFWAFGACFVLVWVAWGLIPANATALALRDHAAVAGSASALLGLAQYGLGSFVAPLAGALGGTPRAVGAIVLVTGLISVAVTLLTVAGERARAREPVTAPELSESQTLRAL